MKTCGETESYLNAKLTVTANKVEWTASHPDDVPLRGKEKFTLNWAMKAQGNV